ncbi:C-type mannose receptor 2-like [Haliotis rufescens]|uniref:C-type mannose receptor 2-like n=1 Tax=Haliotis rufescens TaxID=6454 RepID=UPI00201F5115|nr:C-type mannose receptor 2-like [Haliotis rufescens]
MKSFLQNRASACVWIGGKRKLNKWKWSHSGARITYSSWYPNEPDGRGGIFATENCIEATPTGSFDWNDLSCLAKCHSICQTRWNGKQQKIYDLPDCGAHGGKGYGQSCYVYRSDKLKWNEAKESCIQLNMHLVEISEEDENSFVRYYIMSLKSHRTLGKPWNDAHKINH